MTRAWCTVLTTILGWATAPLPLHSEVRPAVARWAIEGDVIIVTFDSNVVGGLRLIDLDNDTLPDVVDWTASWTEERDCSDFFSESMLDVIGKAPVVNNTCHWYSNNSLEVRLSNPQALNPGDRIEFRDYVIYGFVAELSSWLFYATSSHEILHPDNLVEPAVTLFFDNGTDLGTVFPIDVSICASLRMHAMPQDLNHGGLPSYTWSLHGVSCTYTDKEGDINNYQPTSDGRRELEGLLQDASAGSIVAPTGRNYMNFSGIVFES